MSRLRKLALNTFSNMSITAISALVNLAIIPVFISSYGKELYGVYLLAMGFTGILFSFDLGTSRGLSRFAAEFSANKDVARFSKAVTINCVLLLVFGIISAFLLIGMADILPIMFKVAPQLHHESTQIFRLIGVLIFFSWLSKLPVGILEGFQAYYIKNMFEGISILTNIVLAILIIRHNLAFLTYIKVTIVVKLLVDLLGAYYIYSKRLIEGVKLDIRALHFADVKSEFAKYSLSLFLLQMASMLMFQADKIIIGSLLSVSSVTLYHVISRPMYLLRTLNNIIFSALSPVIAKEHEKGDQAFIKCIIYSISKVHFLVIVPLALLFMFYMKVLFHYWLPAEYIQYTFYASLFCAVYLVTPLFGAIYTALVSIGKMKELVKFNILASVCNALITIPLVMYFGVAGAVIATILQYYVSAAYYCRLGVRLLDLSLVDFFKYAFNKNVILIIVMIAVNAILANKLDMIFMANIIMVLTLNIVIIFMIAYLVILTADERSQLVQAVKIKLG